ncbi:MAG: hypothetical protein ABIJ48_07525 [Actinomycetota bacterium]
MSVQRTIRHGSLARVGLIALVVFGSACATQAADVTTAGVGQTEPDSSLAIASQQEETKPTSPPLDVLVTQVDPIYGYGDYSAYSYAEVPWDLVTAAEIACMRDQGWPVDPIGDTGISWAAVPSEQNEAAQVSFARCAAGLDLPDYGVPSGVEIETIYRFWVDVLKPCLEAEGIYIPDPPSVVSFVETYPNVEWTPWQYVTNHTPELEERCPQNPYDYNSGLEQ